MKLTLGKKRYVAPKPKTKIYREAIKLSNNIDVLLDNLNEDTFDELASFVVEVFKNQFTLDDLYEELDGEEFLPLFTQAIQFAVNIPIDLQEDDKKK